MTRQDLEKALDAGKLEVNWQHNKWTVAKRVGATEYRLTEDKETWFIPILVGDMNGFVNDVVMKNGSFRIV